MKVAALTKYDVPMHAYLHVVFIKSAPLSCVQDEDYQRLVHDKGCIGSHNLATVMFELVQLAKKIN